MAETPYAVSKFLNVIKTLKENGLAEDCEFAINLETITCYENLDAILGLNDINFFLEYSYVYITLYVVS